MRSGDDSDGEREVPAVPVTTSVKPNSTGTRRRWFLIKLAAMATGVLLLVGAIALVWTQHDRITSALEAMSQPQPGPIVILLLSMVATLMVTGLQFQLLLSRHRIPAMEMQGLITGSALLNFLPLKAGLLGRIAYHQVVHGIRPMETAQAMILARVAGLVAITITAVSLFCRDWLDGQLWAWALVPAALPGWFLLLSMTRTAGLVVLLKYVDLLLMAVRYQCAFMLMNEPIGFDVCMALAAIGMLAGAIPFLTGGLGLREWLVGWLTTGLVTLPAALEIGLLADLVNRAAELIVLIPLGGLAIFWLRPRFTTAMARRRAMMAAAVNPEQSPGPEP
ncbi:MAG: hypothetical protein VX527_12745 [Planctomycetota bacterium]|nr:hypothetical protein [Planctomycetota bacterium]